MKRILALLSSVLILFFIFSRLNLRELWSYLVEIDLGLFSVALFLFVPLTVVPAWRWQYLIRRKAAISLGESVKLILVSGCLNIFLPSKMGDLCRAYFLKKQGKMDIKRGINVVIFERYLDTAALSAMALGGVLANPGTTQGRGLILILTVAILCLFPMLYFFDFSEKKQLGFLGNNFLGNKIRGFLHDAQEYLAELKSDPGTLWRVIAVSLVLWFLHLLQFFFVFRAIHAAVPWQQIFSLVPMAIFIGMLPITVAGVGSRDAALIFFFAPYAPASQMAFIGIFATLRYLVPGLGGAPFLGQYVAELPRK